MFPKVFYDICLEIEKKLENKENILKKYSAVIVIAFLVASLIFLAVSGINFGQWLANTAMDRYISWSFSLSLCGLGQNDSKTKGRRR
ncbi:MAG: hypothetical protein ACOC35_05385 [Promethearchaeia archaeon]